MKNNVINFKRTIEEEPTDLLPMSAFEVHGFSYSYLYKWACQEGKITIYPKSGKITLSLAEVIEFDRNRIRGKYGRN